MLEFRLVYQGVLKSDNRRESAHKQLIRRYLHKQLVNLWNTKYPLKSRLAPGKFISGVGQVDTDFIANRYAMGGKRYVPIVTDDLALACSLDILLLRRDFSHVIESGDLDNRVKTIIDALRIPKSGENSDGDEDPLYCLLEDDRLVSEIRVVGDLLLAEPSQVVDNPRIDISGEEVTSKNHAFVVIHAKVKPTKLMIGNMDFA